MVDLNRRGFFGGLAGATAVAAAAMTKGAVAQGRRTGRAGSMFTYAAPKLDTVRCGVIGLGERGTPMLETLLSIQGVRINALCDVDTFVLDRAMKVVADKQGAPPARITGNNAAFTKLCDRNDIDVVFIFTPWDWHAPMALATMKAGKHAFVEVPIATTVEDMWKLVETSEATQRHCMMMENCCYGRDELMVLNMVRQNLFGELLHGQGAYIHELKNQLAKPDRGEGVWRPFWQTRQRGNLYPTHGLGPVAQYMNINRGDRLDYVVAMDSPALGMAQYAQKKLAPGNPRRNWKFITGDMSSSLIKTVKGRTILVQHDINSPRPYNRLNYIQGTNGAFGGYPNRIAVDEGGLAPNPHKWDTDMARYYAKYDHPLWIRLAKEAAANANHGGMDFVMMWRIIACLRNGLPVDQPVYDGAAWSALFDLTDKSVRNRSAPQTIPDFTRGAWQTAASFQIAV